MNIRPMAEADVAQCQRLAAFAFNALDTQMHREPMPLSPQRSTRGRHRIAHLLSTDPGGAWVAQSGAEVVGVALAFQREGVWGLSLLTVSPTHQSSGVGRQLLDAALAYGAGCRGWIIMSSDDPRALRSYGRAGLALLPTVHAVGIIRSARPTVGHVRVGSLDDLERCAVASRFVRGASHTPDIPALIDIGATLFVCDDDRGVGFATARDGTPSMIAATSAPVAADLLRAAISEAPAGAEITIEAITHAQQWAVEVALEVGLSLRVSGALFLKGDVGPMAPYVPSGYYL
jgi:GNAT superfamily N-acetyltransferase